ncbi:hypothetical protein LSTR_LSTR012439 [Laodelphax striatellus]|uniref:Uncharacterized protein n=1 Tax=Laodelphax striatellus TaxID=195883 RepID=A0A482WEG9_LAOST|nr:hypothetical protein LSTR_LSTR012439 [Laodelphax striatellus]
MRRRRRPTPPITRREMSAKPLCSVPITGLATHSPSQPKTNPCAKFPAITTRSRRLSFIPHRLLIPTLPEPGISGLPLIVLANTFPSSAEFHGVNKAKLNFCNQVMKNVTHGEIKKHLLSSHERQKTPCYFSRAQGLHPK